MSANYIPTSRTTLKAAGHNAAKRLLNERRIISLGDKFGIWNETESIYDTIPANDSDGALSELVELVVDVDGWSEGFSSDWVVKNFSPELAKLAQKHSRRNGVNMNPKTIVDASGFVIEVNPEAMQALPTAKSSPDMANLIKLPWTFKELKECNWRGGLWDKFTQANFVDIETRDYYMATVMDAYLNGACKLERMPIVLGVGGSGKSTLLNAVMHQASERLLVASVNNMDDVTKSDSRELFKFASNMFVVCSDASSPRNGTETIKKLVSRESVSARRLYAETEDIQPRAQFLINSNKYGIGGTLADSGNERRFDIFEFNKKPERVDVNIGSKLASPEVQRQLFACALECLNKALKEGGKLKFERPESVKEFADVQKEMDPLYSYIQTVETWPMRKDNFVKGYRRYIEQLNGAGVDGMGYGGYKAREGKHLNNGIQEFGLTVYKDGRLMVKPKG